ncbi:hypothetical protein AAG565_10160 [Fontimonas sp. SYSU GA230001]|uniref:hypothetical protein n=1 Tax=Fontimonas sp. SYSU GA230001 TaxID=3142450 RepID=UPI0032B56F31
MAILLLCLGNGAAAVERIELSAQRIDAPGWSATGVRVDWRPGGAAIVEATVRTPRAAIPAPLHVRLQCPRLPSAAALACDRLALRAAVADLGTLDALLDVQMRDAGHWRADLHHADLALDYNGADGRIATEGLRVALQGSASAAGGLRMLDWRMQTGGGQAYVEPAFADFGTHPLRIDGRVVLPARGAVRLERLDIEQTGVGTLTARAEFDAERPLARHHVELELALPDTAAAAGLYLRPLLATTPLHDLELAGSVTLRAALIDRAPLTADLELAAASVAAPGPAVALQNLRGTLHWQYQTPGRPSQLEWAGGSVGRIPIGATRLAFIAAGSGFALIAPAQLPVLDGALEVSRFALDRIGDDQMSADVDMRLRPIDLRALCRSLGWPEFTGTLAGSLPGLKLRERRLDIDGVLEAAAFDGRIEVRNLSVIEPFGVLPRVKADVRLRRLDLALLTGAFDFGRITGRLDGDFDGLRLIGWEPVAMDARLYSSARDDRPRRISQRAIDNISSIGGGPTGLLSRGFFSLFDDFAYARIGWRCVLDNGICRMSGIGPARQGDGYVLVQGRSLPRIDVVGYSKQVSWPVFLAQLRSIGRSGPAQVSSELR